MDERDHYVRLVGDIDNFGALSKDLIEKWGKRVLHKNMAGSCVSVVDFGYLRDGGTTEHKLIEKSFDKGGTDDDTQDRFGKELAVMSAFTENNVPFVPSLLSTWRLDNRRVAVMPYVDCARLDVAYPGISVQAQELANHLATKDEPINPEILDQDAVTELRNYEMLKVGEDGNVILQALAKQAHQILGTLEQDATRREADYLLVYETLNELQDKAGELLGDSQGKFDRSSIPAYTQAFTDALYSLRPTNGDTAIHATATILFEDSIAAWLTSVPPAWNHGDAFMFNMGLHQPPDAYRQAVIFDMGNVGVCFPGIDTADFTRHAQLFGNLSSEEVEAMWDRLFGKHKITEKKLQLRFAAQLYSDVKSLGAISNVLRPSQRKHLPAERVHALLFRHGKYVQATTDLLDQVEKLDLGCGEEDVHTLCDLLKEDFVSPYLPEKRE